MYSHHHLLNLTALLTEADEAELLQQQYQTLNLSINQILDQSLSPSRAFLLSPPQSFDSHTSSDPRPFSEEKCVQELIVARPLTIHPSYPHSHDQLINAKRRSNAHYEQTLAQSKHENVTQSAQHLAEKRAEILQNRLYKQFVKQSLTEQRPISQPIMLRENTAGLIDRTEHQQLTDQRHSEKTLQKSHKQSIDAANSALRTEMFNEQRRFKERKAVLEELRTDAVKHSMQQSEAARLNEVKERSIAQLNNQSNKIAQRESAYHFLAVTNHIAKQQRSKNNQATKESLHHTLKQAHDQSLSQSISRKNQVQAIKQENLARLQAQSWIMKQALAAKSGRGVD